MGRVLWSICLPSPLLSFFPLLLIFCLLSAGEAAQVLDLCIPHTSSPRTPVETCTGWSVLGLRPLKETLDSGWQSLGAWRCSATPSSPGLPWPGKQEFH